MSSPSITAIIKNIAYADDKYRAAYTQLDLEKQNQLIQRQYLHDWIIDQKLAHDSFVMIEGVVYQVRHHIGIGGLHCLVQLPISFMKGL